MTDLLYALAPAGATHHIHGFYRKFDSGQWCDWYAGEWLLGSGSLSRSYEPIPERELELNRLANDPNFDYVRYNSGHGINTSDVLERREIRIEYGLIKTSEKSDNWYINEKETKTMIKFKKLTNDAVIPVRKSVGAAGFDIYATSHGVVAMGYTTIIETGIAVSVPPGYVGLIQPRSGLAFKHGIDTMAGTIDSDYRGEIKVELTTFDQDENITINPGERIAQLVVVPFLGDAEEVDELDDTERGTNGFGSTGVK
jgi:dUTP pyrophosphatase